MKLRLEMTASKASGWPWVLRLLKSCAGYRVVIEGTMEIHIVDFRSEDKGRFLAIWDHVGGWKQVSVFIDGELVPKSDVNRVYHGFFLDRQRQRFVDRELQRIQQERLQPPPDEPI